MTGRVGRAVAHQAYGRLADLRKRGERLTTTRFTYAELYAGVERSTDPKRELSVMKRLLWPLLVGIRRPLRTPVRSHFQVPA